jgi:hypothetical protein
LPDEPGGRGGDPQHRAVEAVWRLESARIIAGADLRIRWTTIGCMGLLAMIAGTVSYLHTHLLVARHGQPVWVAALTPLCAWPGGAVVSR